MNKTIGILAHVDAGKTTFSEQLLYHTNSVKHRGRVDHQDAFLDSHGIERARGITVFADQGMFTFGNSHYTIIDTPGHVDFSPEMERGVQAMDYAIIIISAVEGIEGHTETVWELLRKHHIPTFFFINKTDRVGANVEQVIEDIRLQFTKDVLDLTKGNYEEVAEFIAERDEELLNDYLDHGYEEKTWLATMRRLINENQLFPCTSGSALQDIGIESFLQLLEQLTETNYTNDAPFSGRVYKIRYDEKGTRLTFIKALSGQLKVRDELPYGDLVEKVTQIRKYNGNQYKPVTEVCAGELFAVAGLTNAQVGDGIGQLIEKATYEMQPTLKSKVTFEEKVHVKEALNYFNILDAEDPSLNVTWEEALQEIHLHVMGKIQLEVLQIVVEDRFGLTVTFEEPEILYKETIVSPVIGYGHFEPLKHYAEVHLKIEPNERNRGITFKSACHADDLTVGNQNLIRHHLFEREHHGLLTGSPLTDVNITLITGRAHEKHTHGGDFREATFRALRQGLEKATNILLEPIYQFKIKVDVDQMGHVLSDIQKAHGTFDTPQTEGEKVFITGIAPVATFMDYSSQLASFTGGRGTMTLSIAGYERCHNEVEVIERLSYNKNADPLYTSSSVFCAKGAGYTVQWDEAEAKMHCLK
ncbi:GTP-binding protein [Chungangia koreensis]|uniref:GTP-binding protein n=1 Tax=Chungangia koreensis TaxID=752657 RepID=A0ABV8X9M4_9LACT